MSSLRKFVEEFHPVNQKSSTTLFHQIANDATQNTSREVARAIMEMQNNMKKEYAKQKDFVIKKSSFISEDMSRLWNISLKSIQRLLKELEKRSKLILETESLTKQNNELDTLLREYIQSEEAYDLIFPPVETTDFRPPFI